MSSRLGITLLSLTFSFLLGCGITIWDAAVSSGEFLGWEEGSPCEAEIQEGQEWLAGCKF